MLGLCFNPTGFSELGSLLGVRRFCSPLDFAVLDQEANLLTVASFGLQGSPGRYRYSCAGTKCLHCIRRNYLLVQVPGQLGDLSLSSGLEYTPCRLVKGLLE